MKSKSVVEKKLKDVKYRYLSKEFKSKLKKCPDNCQYNKKVTVQDVNLTYKDNPLVNPEDLDFQTYETRLCMYDADSPEEWGGKICDDIQTAQECGLFLGKYDKEDIRQAFEASLEDEEIVAQEYKDIAALQWVVGEKVYEWDLTLPQKIKLFFLYYLSQVSLYLSKVGI